MIYSFSFKVLLNILVVNSGHLDLTPHSCASNQDICCQSMSHTGDNDTSSIWVKAACNIKKIQSSFL